jgi:flagellar biosynthesis/type III secretory pathway chaperone
MKEILNHLIESLRDELKEYGEMLTLLDTQQQMVMHRQTQDLLQCVSAINLQSETVAAARREREQRQRRLARQVGLLEEATFGEVLPHLPADYRPLLQALVAENNELLMRVRQRARQNHLLLNRIVELMQRFLGSLFPGAPPSTYNDTGLLLAAGLPQRSIYDAVG